MMGGGISFDGNRFSTTNISENFIGMYYFKDKAYSICAEVIFHIFFNNKLWEKIRKSQCRFCIPFQQDICSLDCLLYNQLRQTIFKLSNQSIEIIDKAELIYLRRTRNRNDYKKPYYILNNLKKKPLVGKHVPCFNQILYYDDNTIDSKIRKVTHDER